MCSSSFYWLVYIHISLQFSLTTLLLIIWINSNQHKRWDQGFTPKPYLHCVADFKLLQAWKTNQLIAITMKEVSLACLAEFTSGCTSRALDKIKKHLMLFKCTIHFFMCMKVCLCLPLWIRLKWYKQTFLFRQSWGILCSPTPLPLLFFSCQCQRSGSVNGPDGCRTQSPSLSLFSFLPPFLLYVHHSSLTPPPTFFHHSFSSLLTPLSVLSWHHRGGYTALSCPGLCCQAFPKLNFPSLTAVCLLRRLPEK